MGGKGIPNGWKWCAGSVEKVSRVGGNGVPGGWKRYPGWVEMVNLGVEIVFNTSRTTVIRM
jgi:hypothetical protein